MLFKKSNHSMRFCHEQIYSFFCFFLRKIYIKKFDKQEMTKKSIFTQINFTFLTELLCFNPSKKN